MLKPEIKSHPPGPRASSVINKENEYLATTTKHLPVVIKRAKGAIIEDIDGNQFLDFTSGVAVTNIGHCHPIVVEAIKQQVEKFLYFAGTDFSYELQAELAEKLAQITPGSFSKKVFFSNSGAEAIEAAIKLTKQSRKRHQFIGFIGAFHGRTLGANAFIGCKTVQRKNYFPMLPGVLQLPYAYCYRCPYHEKFPQCDVWCAKIIEEIYFQQIIAPDEVGAILVEPIQGEGGYIVPPDRFLQELYRIAKKYGILFIADEIQTGLGRTGKMFAVEYPEIEPDIITIAKGIASGLPMGATVFNSQYDFQEKGAHSNTFGGNPVCSAAALANLQVIQEEKLTEKALEQGNFMKAQLTSLQKQYDFIGDVRGRGMFVACEFVLNKKTKTPAVELVDDLVKYAFSKGLILIQCGRSSIRLIPPLNIPQNQLEIGLEIFKDATKYVAQRFKRYRRSA